MLFHRISKERLEELYRNPVFTDEEKENGWRKCECGVIHNSIVCSCIGRENIIIPSLYLDENEKGVV